MCSTCERYQNTTKKKLSVSSIKILKFIDFDITEFPNSEIGAMRLRMCRADIPSRTLTSAKLFGRKVLWCYRSNVLTKYVLAGKVW